MLAPLKIGPTIICAGIGIGIAFGRDPKTIRKSEKMIAQILMFYPVKICMLVQHDLFCIISHKSEFGRDDGYYRCGKYYEAKDYLMKVLQKELATAKTENDLLKRESFSLSSKNDTCFAKRNRHRDLQPASFDPIDEESKQATNKFAPAPYKRGKDELKIIGDLYGLQYLALTMAVNTFIYRWLVIGSSPEGMKKIAADLLSFRSGNARN